MSKLQKNPGRLLRQLRPQPDIELWKKWAREMREELYLNYEQSLEIPIPASRLRVVDKHRRMFDSRNSNPQEAIETPDNHPTYWKSLAEHPGGDNAKPCDYSVWAAWENVRGHPGLNLENFEVYDRDYAVFLR